MAHFVGGKYPHKRTVHEAPGLVGQQRVGVWLVMGPVANRLFFGKPVYVCAIIHLKSLPSAKELRILVGRSTSRNVQCFPCSRVSVVS